MRASNTPFPSKLPLPIRDLGEHLTQCSLSPPEPTTKQHLDRFSRFCRAYDCDRPTYHATRSVTIGRIYVRSTAMRSKSCSVYAFCQEALKQVFEYLYLTSGQSNLTRNTTGSIAATHGRYSLQFTMGRPFPLQNCPFPLGDLNPLSPSNT